MKIKHSFITNSSSSNFCIVGCAINMDELRKNEIFLKYVYNKTHKDKMTFKKFLKNINLDYKSEGYIDLEYVLREFYFDDIGILVNYDYALIGKYIESLDENDTLYHFKNEIKEKLKEIGIITPSVSIEYGEWSSE